MSSVSTGLGPPVEASMRHASDATAAAREGPGLCSGPGSRSKDERRLGLARAILRLLREANLDPAALEIVLDEGHGIAGGHPGPPSGREAVAQGRAAGFEVIDVQSLRPHYALTLAAWTGRLEARWPEAVDAVGDEVARTWRLYMSAARLGFESADLDVCQLLLAKPGGDRPATLPLRPWW